MKLKINQSEFLAALSRVRPVVKKHTPLPALSGVLLRVTDHLELTASNLDESIRTTCPCVIEQGGTALLPGETLYQLVSAYDGDIEVSEVADRRYHLKAGRRTSELAGMDVNEFEKLPLFPQCDVARFVMGQSELLAMLKHVSPAVSTDEGRYTLNGVLFELQANRLNLVACMGAWMAMDSADVKGDNVRSIVHSSGVDLLLGLLDEGEATVAFGENVAQFTSRTDKQETVLSCKLIDGQYPDYGKFIPADYRHTATVPREALLSAIECAGIYNDPLDIRLRLHFEKELLTVTQENKTLGRFTDTIPVQFESAEGGFSITFNGQYITKALRGSKADSVTISMNDNFSAVKVTDGTNYITVLVPLRM